MCKTKTIVHISCKCMRFTCKYALYSQTEDKRCRQLLHCNLKEKISVRCIVLANCLNNSLMNTRDIVMVVTNCTENEERIFHFHQLDDISRSIVFKHLPHTKFKGHRQRFFSAHLFFVC